MLRRRLILFFKLAVAFGLIYWLAASGRIDLRKLAEVGERWPWFVAAQVPFGIVMLLAAYRWRLLLQAQGIHYTFWDTFSLTMIGQLFNQVVIGTTGGDMVKAYAVAIEHPSRKSGGIMSVVVDRLVGLIVLIVFALGAMAFNLELIRSRRELMYMSAGIGLSLIAALGCLLVFYSDALRRRPIVVAVLSRLPFRKQLIDVANAVYVYKFHPKEVALSIVVSFWVHIAVVIMNLLLAKALIDDPLPVASFFFLIPIAQVGMAVPINPPGAIGTAEGIYEYLLPLAGVPHGAMICILQRFTYYLWAALGAVFYVRRKGKVAGAVQAALSEDAKPLLGEPQDTAGNEPKEEVPAVPGPASRPGL